MPVITEVAAPLEVAKDQLAPEAVRLPLDHIDANARNPRRDLAEVDALAENIAEFGLMQPVAVRRVGKRYELLSGHRRLAAVRILHAREPAEWAWQSISAVVRSMDDEVSQLAMISAHVHTVGWSAREEAAALERLVTSGMTVEQIGDALHRTKGWASKRLRIYTDSIVSGYVQSGKLATTVGEELLVIRDTVQRKELADRAAAESWSQSRARTEVRQCRADALAREVSRRARALAEQLRHIDTDLLGVDALRDLLRLSSLIEERFHPVRRRAA